MSQQVNQTTFTASKNISTKGFSILPNNLIRNGKILSDSAFRLLAYLLSNSETWIVYQGKMREDLDWGRDKLQGYIKELEEKKYLKRTEVRSKDGRFSHHDYEFFTEPFEENSNNFTATVFSGTGLSGTGKPEPTNTNLTNTNLNEVVCSAAPVGSHLQENLEENLSKEEDLKAKKDLHSEIIQESLNLPSSLTKTTHSGNKISISFSEAVCNFIREKKDYTTKEINFAWRQLSKATKPISDCFSYLDGVIKHQRTMKKNEAFISKQHKEEICKTQTEHNNTNKPTNSNQGLLVNGIPVPPSPKSGKWVSIMDRLLEP